MKLFIRNSAIVLCLLAPCMAKAQLNKGRIFIGSSFYFSSIRERDISNNITYYDQRQMDMSYNLSLGYCLKRQWVIGFHGGIDYTRYEDINTDPNPDPDDPEKYILNVFPYQMGLDIRKFWGQGKLKPFIQIQPFSQQGKAQEAYKGGSPRPTDEISVEGLGINTYTGLAYFFNKTICGELKINSVGILNRDLVESIGNSTRVTKQSGVYLFSRPLQINVGINILL